MKIPSLALICLLAVAHAAEERPVEKPPVESAKPAEPGINLPDWMWILIGIGPLASGWALSRLWAKKAPGKK